MSSHTDRTALRRNLRSTAFNRLALVHVAAATLLLAGCSDSDDDCAPTAPCASANLRVEQITVNTDVAHPMTGNGAVHADTLVVHYSVINAGNVASPERVISVVAEGQGTVIDTVPPLARGARYQATVRVPITERYFRAPRGDVVQVRAELASDPSDLTASDDTTRADPVHVARPILELVIAPAVTPRVRANEAFPVSLTLRNLSAIAAAEDIQLRHCLWDFDVACYGDYWTAFGTVPLEDLAPGEQRTLSYALAVPPEATYFDITSTYFLNVCVTPAGDDAPYVPVNRLITEWACGGAWFLEVWPDFDACPPAMLGTGPVTLDEPNCGFYPPSDPPRRFPHALYVWALDAEAGVTYAVSGLPGPVNDRGDAVQDLDPDTSRLRVQRSGRVYFVVHATNGVRTGNAQRID